MKPEKRKADGLTIRYAESAAGGDERVLLVNPWPESLFAWDTIWPALLEAAHLVAIDLPGFGQSEGRRDLFSPHAMGSFLIRLVDEWGLGNPHLIGPDVGSGATLFALSEQPDRFPSAIVGSGGASVPLDVTGALRDLIEAPDVEPFRAIDGRDIVAQALQGLQKHELPDDIREDYMASYAGDRFVESMAYVRAYPTDLPALAERLPGISTPVQIIAGKDDDLVPPSNAEFLHARLPNSKLDIFDTGHFTWEDGADDYLALATTWITEHRASRSSKR
jgi:pimeloyl-ACP methyl ester carboxylesterase